MLYLEIGNHNCFSSLIGNRYIMIHENYLLAMPEEPIVYDENDGTFKVWEREPKIGTRGYYSHDAVYGEPVRIDPSQVWRIDQRLNRWYRLELMESSNLCTSPESYGMKLKQPYFIDYRPYKLEGQQLLTFIKLEQMFNDEGGIGDCPFESWMIADFKARNITSQRRGPLNLFQIRRFSKPVGEDKERISVDITLEELTVQLLGLPLKDNPTLGVYDPEHGTRIKWSEQEWFQPEE